MLREMNVVELLFVSDGAIYFNSTLSRLPMDEVLITVNFMNERGALDTLNKIQVGVARVIAIVIYTEHNNSHNFSSVGPITLIL